jgi:hypothetical protein
VAFGVAVAFGERDSCCIVFAYAAADEGRAVVGGEGGDVAQQFGAQPSGRDSLINSANAARSVAHALLALASLALIAVVLAGLAAAEYARRSEPADEDAARDDEARTA